MKSKLPVLAFGAAIGAGTAILGAQGASIFAGVARAASADTYRQLNLFGDVFDKIRNEYVDKPDEAKLTKAAIDGMMAALDPHSEYMDPKSYKAMQVQTNGEFGGLGLEVALDGKEIKVVTPIDGTPAKKAGVLSGDVIVAIDGAPVKDMTLNQAVDKMRGAPKTPVKISVERGPKRVKMDFTIMRDVIKVQSVTSHMIDGDVGYVRISEFTEQTYPGLKKAMADIDKAAPGAKLKGYVLDLRNNPGGLLDQSISVVNAFVDKGEVVSTRGRTVDETQRFNARPGGDLSHGKPLVVLINGGSASASEIVSGALQDHKRAKLVGTRSFGKGSVQTIIPLANNGALRLTTARYFTPSGRSIQAQGIVPDYKILEDVPTALKGKDTINGEASLKGHLLNGTTAEKHGSQAYVPPDAAKDKQLTAAVDLLEGKPIPPDFLKAAEAKTPATPAAKDAASATAPAAPATPAAPAAPATPAAPAKN